MNSFNLNHSVDELANEDLVVTVVTTLVEVTKLLAEATRRAVQLEGPEEVGSLLEVRTHSVDLVDEVFRAHDTELTKNLLNLSVLSNGNTLVVELGITTLVDQSTNGLEVGITVGNVGLNKTEHLHGGLGQTDEHGVVDLTETEELKSLAHLGRSLVDTTNTDNNSKTTLSFSKEMTISMSLSSLGNKISLSLNITHNHDF